MDAVEFLKEAKRAKEYYEGFWSVEQLLGNPEWSVQQIEFFSKEHPSKTRLQDFLEKYPKTPISSKGVPTRFCPQDIGYKCKYECNRGKTPPECWNEPVEE